MPRLHNILVANRGEIALRVLRTARALGYRTTAIYSEVDRAAPHVAFADAAVCIGPAPVGASYLNIDRIVAAARDAGADAVHPGYGLLSENAAFARACAAAGLVFIGPSPETIELMGDKRRARIAMHARGVPCVPGYDGEDQSDPVLVREASRIGFPVMVKAAAGGGGRGMRRVAEAAGLLDAIARARSEAEKAFGDGRLILERALDGARHVEVQIFADAHGHVIHLGERDCSVQRRFQKVIEEAPSPAVDAALRRRLGEVAVLAARSSNYLGAGTVELLLAPSSDFYFLEMNTRIQVEHPVTEMVTGLDLVAWQLRIAEGEALPLTQQQVELRGHAIEARLYAEDPARGFIPATGRVLHLSLPDPGIARVDHALAPGLVISPHYDPLLCKIIAHGADRQVARRRLHAALTGLRILGVQTNQAFLREVLAHEVFAAGAAATDFLDLHMPPSGPVVASSRVLAVAAFLFATREQATGTSTSYAPELAGFSNCVGLLAPLLLECDGQSSVLGVQVHARGAGASVHIGGECVEVTGIAARSDACEAALSLDGVDQRVAYAFDGDCLFLHLDATYRLRDRTFASAEREDLKGSGRALAPMDGSVVQVEVALGQRVQRGQTLVVVEAMKLELKVVADVEGVVAAVHAVRGSQVKARQLLVELRERDGEAVA